MLFDLLLCEDTILAKSAQRRANRLMKLIAGYPVSLVLCGLLTRCHQAARSYEGELNGAFRPGPPRGIGEL